MHIRQHPVMSAISAILTLACLCIISLVVFSEPLARFLTQNRGSERIGRELVINGPLKINWHLKHTDIHAEDIRLGNAPGYDEPDMMTIESLDFSFNPLKLLIGKLDLSNVKINKPFLILEKKDSGDKNWDFPALSKANVASHTVLADNRHNFPLIGRLNLTDGRVIYRDHVRGLDLDLQLNTASANGGEKGSDTIAGGFTVEGSGLLQKKHFEVSASGGSLDTLRETSKDFPLDLKLVMGSTEAVLKGTFKDPVKMTGVNATLNIKGHNLADQFYLTAIPLPPTPPYTLSGQLTKAGDVWGYNDFTGKIGASDISGSLSYDTGGDRGFLKANLVSHLLASKDLGGFIGLPPSGEEAAPEQKAAAAKKKASPKLIPDVPIKLERLRSSDMDVTLKAEKIDAPNLPFQGMDVRFDLKNGVLRLDPLNVILADGTVDGTIEIDGQKDIPPMKMALNLHRLSLGQFFAGTRFEKTTNGYFGGKINLAGQGLSLADVLATSNGEFTIIMSGGRISLLLVEASDLDLGQALPLVLGDDKSTAIRCGVADFLVKDGLLNSKVFVLDTTDSLLVGKVGIDLKREVINAKLDAKPKDNSLLSAQSPIVVSGKLKKPSIGLDPGEIGVRGAAAAVLGTLLTPFAAILPFIETGKVQNADCRSLINQAGK